MEGFAINGRNSTAQSSKGCTGAKLDCSRRALSVKTTGSEAEGATSTFQDYCCLVWLFIEVESNVIRYFFNPPIGNGWIALHCGTNDPRPGPDNGRMNGQKHSNATAHY